MIIRQEPKYYVFITQHDHAYIAGELLTHLKKEFIAIKHYESLKFAVHQHDRAWIIPDSHPIYNDSTKKPFSFLDYPEKLKLQFYKLGIEQVNHANSYAALLCSMHYCNLVKLDCTEDGRQFIERELQRQKLLMNKLEIEDTKLLIHQTEILKLCDDISLYICMNKPGILKRYEDPLFRKGFEGSEFFHKRGDLRIYACYRENERNILRFNSSPFEDDFDIKVPVKRIPMDLIKDIGLAAAYHAEPTSSFTIKLIREWFLED